MKFWGKKTPVQQAKSSSYFFNAGALKMMQANYEAYATEGYGLNPIVHACVNKIATTATSMDLKAYKKANGKLIEVDNHPILELLNKPNPMQTGDEFLSNFIRYYLIAGNAYAYAPIVVPEKPTAKKPTELYLLKPNAVKIVKGNGLIPIAYEYTVNSSPIKFAVNQQTGFSAVMHKKTFNPIDEKTGLSPMAAAAYGVDVFNSGEKWNLRLLQNEARPSGAMVLKGADGESESLSPDQYNRLKEQIEQQFSGADNAGRPMLLEGGLDWKEMSMNSRDMEHKETVINNAKWICSVYGVPPMLVGVPGESTFANYDSAKLALWTDTVLPLMQSVLASFNAWLAPVYNDGVILWYDEEMISALEPMRKQKADRIEAASYMTINEKRRSMGLDDIEGGNSVLVDSSKVPLDIANGMELPEDGAGN